jgi:hypothetical protein
LAFSAASRSPWILAWRFSSVPAIAGIATFDMMKYSTTKVMTSQTICGG